MKIAYLMSWDITASDGVIKKVRSQTNAWKALGHDVRLFCIQTKQSKTEYRADRDTMVLKKSLLPVTYPRALFGALQSFGPDIVYLRTELFKLQNVRLMRDIPTVLEINSDDKRELGYLARKSLVHRVRQIYNLMTRNIYYGRCAGFASVTHEIAGRDYYRKFKKPFVVVPNTIDIGEFPVVKRQHAADIPRVVFMGTPGHPWHGVDKLMRLAALTKDSLHFDIVGFDQGTLPHQGNVMFHGYRNKKECEEILANCDIGIGTLAFHRLGLNEACPLKVREYLASGLPVILCHMDTAFSGKSMPPWVLQLPNKEENVEEHVSEIVTFCRRMKDYVITHDEVKEFIGTDAHESRRCAFLGEVVALK